MTNDLKRRIYEHNQKMVKGFSNKYDLNYLVYFEEYKDVNEAILREKQLKNWHRQWKINLIRSVNPDFKDLTKDQILKQVQDD